MKIKDRLYISAGISIILVIIIASTVFITSTQIKKITEVGELADTTHRAVSELDIITYEYLLYHEERMEQQWNSKYNSIAEVLEETHALYEEELMKSIHVDYITLGNLFSQVTANYKKKQELIQSGDSEEEINTIIALEERLVARLLITSQSIITDASKIEVKLNTEALKAQELGRNIIIILMMVLLAIVTTTSLLVSRSISLPLHKLTKGAKIIGRGKLEHRIDIKSKDEIGELARAFNKMTKSLDDYITKHRKSEEKLRERAKELSAIYNTSRFMEGYTNLDRAISNVVKILPPALEFQKLACARIVYNGKEHKTKKFKKTKWKISSIIKAGKKKTGVVEVFYLKDRPFLAEEKIMLKEVASQIGNIGGRKKSERARAKTSRAVVASERARAREAEKARRTIEKRAKELNKQKIATLNILEDVKEAREQLKQSIKELKVLDRLKDEFVNISAHELKTPLTPVIGYLDLILKNKRSKLSRKEREQLKISLRNAVRLKDLVTNILDVSKIETKAMKFEMSPVKIQKIIDDVAESLKPAAQAKKLHIITNVDLKLPLVNGDSIKLTQALSKLVENAIKFTDKGKITVSAKRERSNILITVSDNGVGIRKKDIPKLFTKFFQAETESIERRRAKGTGLGLAICKGIIDAHKGKIWVESKGLGKGSTFSFTLPIKRQIRKK